MLTFRSIRFFLVAGGAVAQQYYPSLDEALSGELGAPIPDAVDNNSAAGAEPVVIDTAAVQPTVEPWVPNTEQGIPSPPMAVDPNAAAAVPPHTDALPLPSLWPEPIPAPEVAAPPAPAVDPLNDPAALPPAIPAVPSNPLLADPLDAAAIAATIIPNPTNTSLPADATTSATSTSTTTTTTTKPIESGLSWAATTLPTITKSTRPNTPVFTGPGGSISGTPPSAAGGDAVGAPADGAESADGGTGTGSRGDREGEGEVEDDGPHEDFVLANHWVLPLNWRLGGKDNGRGKGQEAVL